MNIRDVIEGVILICRDNVDGWATESDGTKIVKPDFPPDDTPKSEYPRAMVDVISHDELDQSVQKEVFIGEVMVDVTIFAVNSLEAVELAGDVHQATISHHDDTRSDGTPYFDEWQFDRAGTISEDLEVETDVGFTRHQRSVEFVFETINQTS